MKTLALLLGLAGAALGFATVGSASIAQPSPISRSSTFDSSSEGWTGISNLRWISAGGNPGGLIASHVYSGGHFASFSSSGSWAPGNALGDYGGRLQVDLAAPPVDEAELGFSTNNSSVWPCRDVGGLGSWTTYSTTLAPNGLLDCRTGNPLTPAQVSAALAGFDSMSVKVLNHDVGSYNVGLDNASLSGPQSPVSPPTGTVTRKFRLTYKARKFRGTLTATDDYSCAGTTKVTIFRNAEKREKVGSATTSAPNLQKNAGPATFSFKLKKIVKGSYYASVTSSESPLDGNTCSATRSKGVKVR